jgi:phosphoglucomutase
VSIWFYLWLLLSGGLLFFMGWTMLILFRQKKAWKQFAARHKLRYKADAMMGALRGALPGLQGQVVEGMTIAGADDFAYTDPVDASVSTKQGVRVMFEDGSRFVLRLSGTGTEGATLRLYLERYAAGPAGLDLDPQEALAPVIRAAHGIARIAEFTGRNAPDVVT